MVGSKNMGIKQHDHETGWIVWIRVRRLVTTVKPGDIWIFHQQIFEEMLV